MKRLKYILLHFLIVKRLSRGRLFNIDKLNFPKNQNFQQIKPSKKPKLPTNQTFQKTQSPPRFNFYKKDHSVIQNYHIIKK